MIKEEWKDIKGYEGMYQVSNLGRVRSLDRIRKNGVNDSDICIQKGQMIKQAKQKGSGYMFVSLSKNGITKGFRVHRLVAEEYLGKKRASVGICSCCKGKLKKSYGYRWEYADIL